MIHKNIIILLFLIFPIISFAQFDINKHVLGPSVGFSFLGSVPQFGINHEYGYSLTDLGISKNGKIGIGGIFRYWNYTENYTHVNSSYSDIVLGLQTNYHFYLPNESVDPWLGILLSYDFGSAKNEIKTVGYKINKENYGGFLIGLNAGARYWFNNNIALNLRIGFGTKSYGAIDLGFDYKFN